MFFCCLSLPAELPQPTLTISTPGPTSPTAGQTYSITCFATTVDFIASVPKLKWLSSSITNNSQHDIIVNDQVNGTVLVSRSLTFNHLKTSHGGRYTCQVRIDIPLADISDKSNNHTVDVTVQSMFTSYIIIVVCLPPNSYTASYIRI